MGRGRFDLQQPDDDVQHAIDDGGVLAIWRSQACLAAIPIMYPVHECQRVYQNQPAAEQRQTCMLHMKHMK